MKRNLDLLAAKAAQEIIEETSKIEEASKRASGSKQKAAAGIENLITKALGVLQENGVYAGLLYLHSRGDADRQIAEKTLQKMLFLTSELGLSPPAGTNASENLKFLTDSVCNDLDRLLLVKQLWEQTLIYARYGAKAHSAAKE